LRQSVAIVVVVAIVAIVDIVVALDSALDMAMHQRHCL